mmetsp:Transcript_44254/g.134762  ORF Transcript_44254/g.134762 Transcript_44254/m.134762 type:complete len:111 (-) Transcript_44254:340-672(-)
MYDTPTEPTSALHTSSSFLMSTPRLSPSSAQFCLNESCDLEEYEALINQLQDQRDIMMEHVEKLDSLLGRLKGVQSEVDAGGDKSADDLQSRVNAKLGLEKIWGESVQSP